MLHLNLSSNKILIALVLIFATTACINENFDDPNEVKINRFVWENMNNYYLWNKQLPKLNPDTQGDTKAFFDRLLYDDIDRWSFITDNVGELNKYLAGIRKEFGYSLRPYTHMNRLVAYVEYIEPNSPADKAGLQRGDLITKINGSNITRENYSLLFISNEVKIGLGEFNDKEIFELSPYLSVSAEEIYINPILKDTVFYVEGKKIGYLAYTGFIQDFDDELQNVFANFKTEGISDLILDLRYNGGGSVATAQLMSSMICPASCEGKLFLRKTYNKKIEAAIRQQTDSSTAAFEDYFKIDTVPNLNLSDLYVLTTPGTASASEMVIYSLAPYMNVVQIGEKTHGKYYGSITIAEPKKHNWAIQPIVMRFENSGTMDYSQGLIPNFNMNDNFTHALGSIEDVLTSFAIQQITGVELKSATLKSANNFLIPANYLKSKKHPLQYEMYIK